MFEWEGAFQQVRVEGAELVYERDESREPLDVDPAAAAALAEWYALGDDVLRGRSGGEPADRCGPSTSTSRSSSVEGEANYGFSPGDEAHAEPYAYVGPWTAAVRASSGTRPASPAPS